MAPLPPTPVMVTQVVTLVPFGSTPAVTRTPSVTPQPDAQLEALLALPTIQLTVVNAEEFVNLRSGPGSLYEIVSRVETGKTLDCIAISEHGEWLLLRRPDDPNQVAWIYAKYTNYDPALHKLLNINDLKRP